MVEVDPPKMAPSPLREIVARSLDATFTPRPSDPIQTAVEHYWIFTPEQRDASNRIPDFTVEALYDSKDGSVEIFPWLHGERG